MINCKKCGKHIDRNGRLCTKCFISNDKVQHKKDNDKRKHSRDSSNFILRTNLPIRNDIVAMAYGWV